MVSCELIEMCVSAKRENGKETGVALTPSRESLSLTAHLAPTSESFTSLQVAPAITIDPLGEYTHNTSAANHNGFSRISWLPPFLRWLCRRLGSRVHQARKPRPVSISLKHASLQASPHWCSLMGSTHTSFIRSRRSTSSTIPHSLHLLRLLRRHPELTQPPGSVG